MLRLTKQGCGGINIRSVIRWEDTMKRRFLLLFVLCLLMPLAALADKAPACEKLGSRKAAEHLYTHVYAYTDFWDGVHPSLCTDEGCKEYGHVHCYGVRVTLWDTPAKGTSTVPYYPFGTSGKVGPDTEFQLIDVVSYKGKYYANLRIYENDVAVASGFVNADYIGCDCKRYDKFEAVYEYDHNHGPFSLK